MKASTCVDTLADTASPIKDCATLIAMAPCGTVSWGTDIDVVCQKSCGLCDSGSSSKEVVKDDSEAKEDDMEGMEQDGADTGTDHDMSSMSMGCGELVAAAPFVEANMLMHTSMAVSLTCEHTVDFVRAMIPHHKGIVLAVC
jgi:hypothetical protein